MLDSYRTECELWKNKQTRICLSQFVEKNRSNWIQIVEQRAKSNNRCKSIITRRISTKKKHRKYHDKKESYQKKWLTHIYPILYITFNTHMRDANGKQWTHWHYDHVLGFIFTYVQYHFILELVFFFMSNAQFGIRISFCFVSTFPFKVSCTHKNYGQFFLCMCTSSPSYVIPKLVRKWFFDVCTIRWCLPCFFFSCDARKQRQSAEFQNEPQIW